MTTTPKTLTVTECHQLLDALLCRNAPHKSFLKGIRNYTMALLMLDAGLRVGEVVQLRVHDLFRFGKPVNSLYIRAEIAKNKKERIVPLSGRLYSAVTTLAKDFWDWRDLKGSTDPVYETMPAWIITTRQVERIICDAAMKSIGRPVHPHILRHTFATRVERKAGIRITQELLGHKNLASTQIYTHPNQDDLKKAIRGIGEVTTEEIQPGMQKFSPDRSADHIDTT